MSWAVFNFMARAIRLSKWRRGYVRKELEAALNYASMLIH